MNSIHEAMLTRIYSFHGVVVHNLHIVHVHIFQSLAVKQTLSKASVNYNTT